MGEGIVIIFLFLIFIAAVLFIPAYMTERTTVTVVRIFRKHQARSIWEAKTVEELGLGPRSFTDRLYDPRRDYKPAALGMLMHAGVIRQTGQGKLYLSEQGLADMCAKSENRLKVCSIPPREREGVPARENR